MKSFRNKMSGEEQGPGGSRLIIETQLRDGSTFLIPYLLFAFVALLPLLGGCHAERQEPATESVSTTDTVTMSPGSPQLSAVMVEPVSAGQSTLLPLTGRLVWDETMTVRVLDRKSVV